MADIIKMLLQSKIDVDKSILEINKQIEEISQRSDLKKLDLKININPETLKNIDELNKKLGELGSKNIQQSNIKGVVQDFSVLQGQIDDLIKEYSKFGTVTANLSFGKSKDELKRFTIQLKDTQDNIQKFHYILNDDGNFELQNINLLDKTQENYNKTLNETVQIKHKLAQEEIKLQQQIELFKQKQEVSIKNLEGRYKDLYDKKAIAEYRQELQQLNLDTPDVTNKMKQMALGLKDIEVNAKNNKRALDLANKSAMSFGEAVKIAATKFLIWSGVTVAYYAAIRAMRDGIITVKELDTAMVELKKVTDETDATYQDFMKTAFDLGEQLGRTGKEVINATSDFARMGYTLENSIGLAEEALLMVNVGDGIKDIDSATSALIATLKGFEVSGEDSVRMARKINDSFNEVANTYAVDTGRLAEGVKRVSAVLNQSGTTLDQTLGLLTGSFEVLQNMEKSATGLITISQRLRAIGEDGETIEGLAPKLEEAFNSIGLTLLDTNGELKSTYDILSDLAQVFPDLTSKQQAYISELVSGKRQAPVLQALMSNWQTVAKATETSMNSMGSAVKENEKYLNSIEGRIATFQSKLQSFWINAIDSDVIKESISFGTTIIDILDRMNNIFGILPVTIGVATFAMIAFNTKLKETLVLSKAGIFQNLIHGFQSLIATMTGATGVIATIKVGITSLLTTLAAAAPYILIFSAIGYGVQKLIGYIADVNQKARELKETQDQLVSTWRTNKNSINELTEEYKELKKAQEQGKLDSVSAQRLLQVQNELAKLMPTIVDHIDEQGNSHLKNIDAVEKELEYVKKLKIAYDEIEINKFNDVINEISKNIDKQRQKIEDLRKEQNRLIPKYLPNTQKHDEWKLQLNKDIIESEQELFRQSQKLDAELQNQAQRYADINGATETTKKAISEIVDKIIEENKENKDKINIFKDLNDELSNLIPQFSDIGKEIEENKDNFTTEEIEKYKKQLRDTFGDSSLIETFFNIFITLLERSKKGLRDGEESLASLSSILKSFTDDTDKLASAYKTLNDGQTLSLDKIEELLTAYPQLNDALEVNNGMLTINKDAILEVMKAEEKAFKKRVEIWKQEAINVRESILNKLSAYGEEIKSINDVINARNKLAETYSGKRAGLGIVLNYYGNAIEELQNVEDRIKFLQTLGSTDLSKQVTYSGKSSTSKSTTSYESQIDSLREYQIAIQVLESEIKRYQSYAELTTSEQNRIEYLNKINDLTKQQQDKLHELNNELRNQRDSLGEWLEKQGMGVFDKLTGSFDRTTEGIAKYNKMSDEMKKKMDDAIKQFDDYNSQISTHSQKWLELEISIKNNIKTIEDYEDKLKDELDKLATEVINAYKDYYQKRKTIALKSIDDEIKAEEKRHKRVIERLDSELKAYEEIIQAKLKLIDETQDEEEYEKQLTQAQQERQEIQNLINELSMDDSIEARTRVHELNKDLAKKDEQIEKLQNDRSIKLRKKNLNDQLDIYRKEVQAKKDAENQKYERTKERLALEKDEITRYYDNLINDERKYAKIREDILDGHLDEVSKNFDEFTKDLDKNSEIIGESLTENLIDKMAKVRRDLERTLDELNSVKTSSSSRDKSSNSEDKLNLKPGEEKYIGGTKYYKGVDGKNYKSNDGGWTWEEYHDGGIIGGKTDKTTKIVNELFNVQPNEMAIKALKGELMIPPQNIVNNFIPNMKGLINSMPSGGSNINIKEFLKIDNFINNTDTDIDTLVDRATNRFVDRLKPLGLFVKKI